MGCKAGGPGVLALVLAYGYLQFLVKPPVWWKFHNKKNKNKNKKKNQRLLGKMVHK